jgi:hypothetical protein
MKTMMQHKLSLAVCLGLAATAFAQAPGADHVTVPFSDASRPGTVKVNLLAGSISVKGYAGKEVIVDARAREEESHGRTRSETSGMKRIPNLSTGLTVEEEGNVVSISTGSMGRPVDITLQVPARTALKLKTINDGDIKVEQVQGELEVNDINGAVSLLQVSGSVVAHALNGNVKVSLNAVEPNKPMSFSSLNGDIDVTFPPDFKANASMKSDNGEIFSDFDIKLDMSQPQPVSEDARGKGGKYKIKIERTTKGTINGGGPEMQFKTFNGNIYIRKSAK